MPRGRSGIVSADAPTRISISTSTGRSTPTHTTITAKHLHPHNVGRGVTPWALFLIFAFGPCEPLIPLMMVPATARSWPVLAAVIVVFGVVTIGAMLVAVTLGYLGLTHMRLRVLERHIDVLAGLTIAVSGAAVLLFPDLNGAAPASLRRGCAPTRLLVGPQRPTPRPRGAHCRAPWFPERGARLLRNVLLHPFSARGSAPRGA